VKMITLIQRASLSGGTRGEQDGELHVPVTASRDLAGYFHTRVRTVNEPVCLSVWLDMRAMQCSWPRVPRFLEPQEPDQFSSQHSPRVSTTQPKLKPLDGRPNPNISVEYEAKSPWPESANLPPCSIMP
jgi:hypothetical protein